MTTSMGREISFAYNICVFTLIVIYFCKTISAYNSPNSKLPSAIFPTKYHLNISTNIHQRIFTYNGSVSIDLTIKESTNEIVLNAKQLREFKINLIGLNNSVLLESHQINYELNEEKEQLRIFWPLLPLKLQIGQQYQLKIDFVGDIQKHEKFGFFQSYYFDYYLNAMTIIITQFEPTSARLAFPCFDEPAFKAKFVISITHGTNYSAISNMPVDGEPVLSLTSNGEMTTTTFLETPPMSTYYVAFGLTNCKKISVLVNGLEHGLFCPLDSKENGSLALENARKTVDVLEKILGVKYSLPKLDHIPIGKSFGRAMENWGLMTFQYNDILTNQKDYTKLELLDAITVQNHEIVHQWFGNLVTPSSWNYFWLKEGLTTYFSYVAQDMIYPEEKMFEYFLVNEIVYLYSNFWSLDHSMTSIVKEGADLKKNFDIVPYKLGAGFTRMFHHAIGHSTFMKGITKYLNTFQYSVADEDDFFMVMQAAVDEDEFDLFQNNQSVANVMRTWTHNQGIPTVTIIRNYDTGTITIRQKSNSENKDQKWWIPMSFATAANPDFERTIADYVMPPQAEVVLDLKDLNISLSNSDWLIVNKQQTGIFFVVYDDLNLKLIAEALIANPQTIPVFNRALLFRDLTVTFEEELDAIEPLLRILQYLKFEKDSLPWFNAADLIIKLFSTLEGSNVLEKFKFFISDIFIGIYDTKYKLPLENHTATDSKTKSKMMKIKFEIDPISCHNYTTSEKTTNRCSLCQVFHNATLDNLESLFTGGKTLNLGSLQVYEFQIALKCIVSEEIIKHIYNSLSSNHDPQLELIYKSTYEHLLTSNKFFDAWFLNYYNPNEVKGVNLFADKVYKFRSDKIRIREAFARRFENNMFTWLENYDKKIKGN